MFGILMLIAAGATIIVFAILSVVNWHRGYRAGYNDGRADENCKIAQTAYQIEASMADIKKNLDSAKHWRG